MTDTFIVALLFACQRTDPVRWFSARDLCELP